uniref:MD-2-related lipid-recognition domain-containing protein n=1 Tax=Stomoxys calcitrans TaxID=35570 RepID=A0A1I8Q0N2_STOCA
MAMIWKFLVLCICVIVCWGELRFTNLKCNEFHKEFATFEECRLKMVKRGLVALNLHVKLYQLPVNNISVNLALLKKANGYRPFLYNVTTDFCKFLQNPKRVPFVNIFYEMIRKNCNMNHTCPYDHDPIVRNLTLKEEMFKHLPLPNGEYLFRLKVGAYNDWKAEVNVYLLVNTKFGE